MWHRPLRGPRAGTGVRRLVAWVVDWLVIAAYAAALVPVGLAVGAQSWRLSPAVWNAISFAILVVPVTLWLAWWERGPAAASPGKRAMRLRVHRHADGPSYPSAAQALTRNLFKVALPWELGHTAVFIFASRTESAVVLTVGWVCVVLSYGLALTYVVSLFVGSGRPPYDRIAGTRVDRA
jgi:uncharacterized RDD family membrane protein YckC